MKKKTKTNFVTLTFNENDLKILGFDFDGLNTHYFREIIRCKLGIPSQRTPFVKTKRYPKLEQQCTNYKKKK